MGKQRAKQSVGALHWERRFYEVLRVFHSLEGLDTLVDVKAVRRPRAFFAALPIRLLRPSARLGLAGIPQYRRLPQRLPPLEATALTSLRDAILAAVRQDATDRPRPSLLSKDEQAWVESAAEAARASARRLLARHPEHEAFATAAYWVTWFLRQLILNAPGAWRAASAVAREEFLRGCLSRRYRESYQAAMDRYLAGEAARLKPTTDSIDLPPRPYDPPDVRAQLTHLTETLESSEDWSAIADVAARGDRRALNAALRTLGAHTFEWRWVRRVIEGWRHLVIHGESDADRDVAKERLLGIGASLAFGHGRTGRPKTPAERRERLRQWRDELKPAVAEVWQAYRTDGRSGARRVAESHHLDEQEIADLLEGARKRNPRARTMWALVARRSERAGDPITPSRAQRLLRGVP